MKLQLLHLESDSIFELYSCHDGTRKHWSWRFGGGQLVLLGWSFKSYDKEANMTVLAKSVVIAVWVMTATLQLSMLCQHPEISVKDECPCEIIKARQVIKTKLEYNKQSSEKR